MCGRCFLTRLLLALFLLILAILFSACSHTIYSRGPIPAKTDVVSSIDANKESSSVNDLTESKLIPVALQSIHEYFLDFEQRRDSIVDQFESTLQKIGFQADPEAEYILRVSFQNGRFFWGAQAIRYNLNFQVEMNDNEWSTIYQNSAAHHYMNREVDDVAYRFLVVMTW